MRILIPSSSFYPAQEGGPSNAIYWLSLSLVRSGFKIRVVTTDRYINDPTVKFNEWVNLKGIDVIYQTVDKNKSILYNELEKCDILFSNGVCSISNYKLIKKALALKKKVLLSPRGELLPSAINHKGVFYGFLKKSFFYLMKMNYRHKVYYHSTSHEESLSIKKYLGHNSKIVCIPNYILLPDKYKSDIHEGDRYFLYVGRINPIKNLDILIEGLAASQSFRNNSIKLKIAGETKGIYYESLRKLIKELKLEDKIDFLGMVTGSEKEILYANAKFLFLLSKSENFGNVVVESLAQGTPVIASRGTPWSSLEVKKSGFWIHATIKDTCNYIEKILSLSNEEYQMMRNAAYIHSRDFDIMSNTEVWKNLFNKLLK